MKCERCGKEMWTSFTVGIPTRDGRECYKICLGCYDKWYDILQQTFYQFLKEGDKG